MTCAKGRRPRLPPQPDASSTVTHGWQSAEAPSSHPPALAPAKIPLVLTPSRLGRTAVYHVGL
ncbi:hypothetical protein PtA15_1A82 [Puccinia triticina]|uniref:Uncharacterized protein n=1 Tax=Puccinia triticina TaxID=208348 RepID=A0ABY7C6G4_9BASI|nr:uncharacterized protein PtA15_1A82 [Puccinia triticina]WAQ80744.1 hypothetical protein PtA15_1A82 [Puccinia triticina]